MSDIKVIFVLSEKASDETDASDAMKEAFNCCKELVKQVTWMREGEINIGDLNKMHYVVFEELDGRDFSKFIKTKCAVVGPLVITTCFSEVRQIPNFQWPMMNVTMYDCVVTCSQLLKTQKEEVKRKVQLMGGLYSKDFVENVTHLVCDGATSEKYRFAAENGFKLMLPGWIDYLWQNSQHCNIKANDPDILEKYKCPVFHRLTICTTGITSSKEKAKLQDIISTNGGIMVGKLNLSETDVLVCHGTEGSTSEKFKAAKARHLPCVTMDWIFDSIQKGYSMAYKPYDVKAVTSTPTKDSENINPNFSCISSIGIPTVIQKSQINETANLTTLSSSSTGDSKKRKASEDLVDMIDMKRVKNAGNFLDGCSIFVAGFSLEQRDKLNKTVNLSGATRYDNLSERVTHIIIGNPFCSEVHEVKNKKLTCAVVSVQWLIDSIEQKRPAKEEDYQVTRDLKGAEQFQSSSPVSKKALNILKKSKLSLHSSEKGGTLETESVDTLTQKYLSQATMEKEDTLSMLLKNADIPDVPSSDRAAGEFMLKTKSLKCVTDSLNQNHSLISFQPQNSSTQMSADASANTSIFCLYTFFVIGFDEENASSLEEYIQGSGGTIVSASYKDTIDYTVVPVLQKPNTPLKVSVREVVNELFIFESIEEDAMLNIQYYHRPLDIPNTRALASCVVTVSVYTGQEREFLKIVIEGLGGIFQERFSKKNIPSKNVLASTHLVTPEATGKKYDAAIKWNLPVVNKDWLMKCVSTGSKVDISAYIVGNTQISQNSVLKNNDSVLKGNDPSCSSEVSAQVKEITPTKNIQAAPSTPSTSLEPTNPSIVCTPVNQIYSNVSQHNSETYSQVTPINKILQDAIANKILPTPSPKTYYPWDPKTPDTPIGAFIRDNPSPRLRKEMQKYVDSFPEFIPPKRRLSTPLSELRKRLRNKVLYGEECPNSTQQDRGQCEPENPVNKADGEVAETQVHLDEDKGQASEKLEVNQKLKQLHEMVMASGNGSTARRSSRLFEAIPDRDSHQREGVIQGSAVINSQVCTIDWDYGQKDTENQTPKIFMMSGIGVDQRELLSERIAALGGVVSELSSYDEACTHLLCPKPLRNEKTLACMAAGKWILHLSYIDRSAEAGTFLDEEQFEFGNSQSRQNIPYDEKDLCTQFWRKEIKKRGYGAFNGVRAIIVAEKKDPLIKVLEAGEGVIVKVLPPFDDAVHATHCLLEAKVIKDFSQYTPLALQGIKCVNTIYIHEFLRKCGNTEDTSYVLPYFSSYYNSKDNK